MALIWSEIKKTSDTIGNSSRPHGYDHVTAETPLGIIIIDWKGWKEQPSYDIQLQNDFNLFNGTEYNLEDAKNTAEKLLLELTHKLMDTLDIPDVQRDIRVMTTEEAEVLEILDSKWNKLGDGLEPESDEHTQFLFANLEGVWSATWNCRGDEATHWLPFNRKNYFKHCHG